MQPAALLGFISCVPYFLLFELIDRINHEYIYSQQSISYRHNSNHKILLHNGLGSNISTDF